MSAEVISQKVRRTCDACGKAEDFELVGILDDTDAGREARERWSKWYAIIHELYPLDGPAQKLGGLACSLECVPAVAVKPLLPETEESNIDLSQLQVNRGSIN